jgi:Rrf2 family protein
MMEVSSRGRYSLRILATMASDSEGRLFTTREIAEAEDVSSAYAQQLMATLRTAGLVGSHRGKAGGFTLARPAEEIMVADVLQVTEGQVAPAPCLANRGCKRESKCLTRPLWIRAQELLEELFRGLSIADLAAGKVSVHK